MYVMKSGELAESELDKLIDILNMNLTLDIYDIPFMNIGTNINFSRNTLNEVKSYLYKIVYDILLRYDQFNSNILGISYDPGLNVFNVSIKVNNKNINVSTGGI